VKKLCWLTVIAACFAAGGAAPFNAGLAANWREFQNVVFSPDIEDNLALLFSQFDTELVLCLEGERRGSDLYVTDFRMPHILLSETGRVQAAGCRSDSRTVGTWHNHPPVGLTLAASSPDGTRHDLADELTDAALLPPPDGQLVRGEASNDPQATELTQARRR
jgi:hypothetical protein